MTAPDQDRVELKAIKGDLDGEDYRDKSDYYAEAAPFYAPMDCRCGGEHCLPTYPMFDDDGNDAA